MRERVSERERERSGCRINGRIIIKENQMSLAAVTRRIWNGYIVRNRVSIE